MWQGTGMPEYPMVALLVSVEGEVEPDTPAGLERLAAESARRAGP